MPRIHLKSVALLSIFLFSAFIACRGQDADAQDQVNIISFIRQLEKQYDVKFSYLDEDLESVNIVIPPDKELDLILDEIQDDTQLIIKKLSERYYTISKSVMVDICARILDNFENNTLGGCFH